MKKTTLIIALITAFACFFACTNRQLEGTVDATTIDNLKTAIIGETNASATYVLVSEQALNQGEDGIAAMFAAASAAEAIHVQSHMMVLNDLGEGIEVIPNPQISENLEENIQAAIDGETYEYTEMYPPMVKQANKEDLVDAVRTFTYAKKAEERHAKLYTETLELFKAGKSDEIAKIWYVCPVCGNLFNTLEGYEICAICGVGKNTFLHFEK
jgi:rubrerythrin